MNLNEVLSTLVACELGAEKGPDPIEDLALYQSTNDTFASAGVIVAFRIAESLEQGTITLQERLVTLETKFDQVLLTGRTELQDALPMRLGSVFGAWAGAVERDRWRLSKVTERVREVPLGGSALGTGFGAPRRYAHAAERHLRRITGLPFCRSQNMMDGVALKDGLAEVGGALRIAASNWIRIAGDLLSYSSAALGEIHHPNLQFGSSMMPDKTNPVLLERCRGIALSALGEADKIDLYTREGQFQLNAYLPFLLRSLLRCADECLIAQSDLLRFLDSMTVDQERMERNLAGSPAILNALMPLIGYRRLKDLAWVIHQEAPENLQELARDLAEKTDIPLRTLTQALSADRLTGPPKEQS